MADYSELGPSVIEYKRSPVFIGKISHDDGLYLGAVRLITETTCPLIPERRLGGPVRSFLETVEQYCISVCKGYHWRFEIALQDGKIPEILETATIEKRHTGDISYEFFNQGREKFMEAMAQVFEGSFTYEGAIDYIKHHRVALPVHADRHTNPGPRITEYFLNDVIQARVINRCGLGPMKKTDAEITEVVDVFQYAKRKGIDSFQLVDGNIAIVAFMIDNWAPPSEQDN